MRNILALCFTLVISIPVIAGETIVKDYDVTAATQTSTLGIGANLGRKYLLAVNTDRFFDVLMTTGPVTAGTTKGKKLYNTGGYYEDAYFIYKSSWYFISTGTGAATATIREKE